MDNNKAQYFINSLELNQLKKYNTPYENIDIDTCKQLLNNGLKKVRVGVVVFVQWVTIIYEKKYIEITGEGVWHFKNFGISYPFTLSKPEETTLETDTRISELKPIVYWRIKKIK